MTDERRASIPKNALAIIGLAGHFPGARDVDQFWSNISRGVSSIRTLSDAELSAAEVSQDLLKLPNYVKRSAVLDDIDLFDAPFFGFAAREAEILDPQTRLFLQCAWTAMESAGYVPHAGDSVTGVFAGKGFPAYLSCNIASNPDVVRLVGELQTTIYNEPDSLAPITAYKMDLKGPSISVQSFCSTSMLAVHLACQSLLSYECDLAVAGGSALTIPHGRGYLYQEGGILSPDGECRPFDAKANGSLMGSGVGAVILKRLSEAVEDRDCIYAVIRGSATNNDGTQRVGYTAPGVNGQAAVILEALSVAGVEAETIGYIETHGTGTPLGDAIELEAMLKAFALHTKKTRFCAIGSVKPNIGHLDRASGIANLIKTTLTLHRKKLAPCLNFDTPNPDLDLDNSPFYVNTTLQDWKSNGAWPRRAATSSFGLGGTNVHVILEEAPLSAAPGESRPYQHLLLSAKTEGALEIATSNLVNALRSSPNLNLADVAYTLKVGRTAFNHRRMIVCSNAQDGANALAVADPSRVFTAHPTRHGRPVAFMFPGVGDHYAGIGFGLYWTEPTFRKWVDECCALSASYLQCDLREAIYPNGHDRASAAAREPNRSRAGFSDVEGDAEFAMAPLRKTSLAQTAVFVVQYALAQLLMEWGLRADALIGYGVGEYTAACFAGVLSLDDALKLIAKRAEIIESAATWSMLMVTLPEVELEPYLGAQVSLAAVFSATTCVVAGQPEAIEALRIRLTTQEIACRLLPTTHTFHSTMTESVTADLEALFRTVRFAPAKIPFLSTLTGTWITDRQATDPMYWVSHTRQPVRLSSAIGVLLKEKKGLLFEVAPGQGMSAFVREHPDFGGPAPALVLPTLPDRFEDEDDGAFLLTSLGKAWLGGASVNWPAYYGHERRSRVALPTYPFEQQRYWIDPWTAAKDSPSLIDAGSDAKQPNLDKWFYLPTWRQTRLRRPSTIAASDGDAWLLFVDEAGLGSQLAARLEAAGCLVTYVRCGSGFAIEEPNRYRIDPRRREDYRQLLRSLPKRPGHIVHLWAIDVSNDATADGFAAAQQTGFYSLLYLIKALAGFSDSLEIWAITSQAQSATGTEQLAAEHATIAGICRVIPQENLNISCHMIDIEAFQCLRDQGSWLVEQIAAEMSESNEDLGIAYRGRRRLVQVFEPTLLQRPSGENPLREGGVYLIVGGLGDVGMCVGRHLAHAACAKIVLSSRSFFPQRADWKRWTAAHDEADRTSRRIKEFLNWEAAGAQVLVIQADAGDKPQMSALLNKIEDRFGALHGLLYTTGASGDDHLAPIQEITEEQCEAHFRSKVYGLYVLEELIGSRSLDFCVIFSSISSILGGLGFAAYAAANRFVDMFTCRHNDRYPGWWTCVNWDTWRTGEGLHAKLGATVARFDMSPSEANQVLERVILDQQFSQIVNSTGDLACRIDQWVRMSSLRQTRDEPGAPPVLHPRPPLTCGFSPPTTETESLIADVWQNLLGVEPIGINDDFFELGGHSLLATQIIARLRKTFRVHLPLAALLTAPTIAEFAVLVELAIIEELEQSRDKKVEQQMN